MVVGASGGVKRIFEGECNSTSELTDFAVNSLVVGKRLTVAVLVFKDRNGYVLAGLKKGDKEMRNNF
jgi:hypothetical protein